MSIQSNPYPLRIDKTVMAKIKLMAKISGRSVNKEIEYQLKESIRSYEAANAALPVEEAE